MTEDEKQAEKIAMDIADIVNNTNSVERHHEVYQAVYQNLLSEIKKRKSLEAECKRLDDWWGWKRQEDKIKRLEERLEQCGDAFEARDKEIERLEEENKTLKGLPYCDHCDCKETEDRAKTKQYRGLGH